MKTALRKPVIGSLNDSIVKKCICDRAKKAITCTNCGFYFKGRVRSICAEHPHVMFMMDFEYCPACLQADKLKEVD